MDRLETWLMDATEHDVIKVFVGAGGHHKEICSWKGVARKRLRLLFHACVGASPFIKLCFYCFLSQLLRSAHLTLLLLMSCALRPAGDITMRIAMGARQCIQRQQVARRIDSRDCRFCCAASAVCRSLTVAGIAFASPALFARLFGAV